MPKSIGIDLGTTNSAAAIKRVGTEVLKNAEGEFITPSCVALVEKKGLFGKSGFVVGRDALEWMKQNPANTVVAVKRLMGRNIRDEEIQRVRAETKLTYSVAGHSKGSENSLAITLGRTEYTPEEISSQIVKKVRADAEKALGDTVDAAVITVPAYFNDKQKHATRVAASLAGLKTLRLLPEPTAAAISFGVDAVKGDDAKTVLVFDFGGGTFDLSVLTISGGQFIEQGKGGDMWLGGTDIDDLIGEHVLAETAKACEIEDISALIEEQDTKAKHRFSAELKAKAEQAKIALSSEESAYIEILGILKDRDGDAIDVDVELTRAQFEQMLAPTVKVALVLTRKLIENIQFTPDLIDDVLLVGGSSRIPCVVAALEKEFGEEKVLLHERPMLAIAEGAAILSHRLSDTYECPRCSQMVPQSDSVCAGCGFDLSANVIESGVFDIVHAAAHDYYLHLENEERHLFVEKNTPLPCEKSEVFKLVHPEQKLVHMKFCNLVNESEEPIGDLWLGIESRASDGDDDEKDEEEVSRKGADHVRITLKIDENNVLEVAAAMEEHPEVTLSKTLSRGQADEKLFLSLEETIDEANREKYRVYAMDDLRYRAVSAIADINRVVNQETGEVDGALCDHAALKIEKARRMAVESHAGRATYHYAEAALQDFRAIIPRKTRALIRKGMDHLEAMDERGTYEENVQAIEDLEDTLNDNLEVVSALMEIQKAGEFCAESAPSRASKFFRCVDDVTEAIRKGKQREAYELVAGIMPEVSSIVGSREAESDIIHKDIRR